MRNFRKNLCCLALAASLASFGQAAWSQVDPDDQKLIDAASCEELLKEFKNYSEAEKKLADELRKAKNSNVATNVLGISALALLGVGFFTWDDHHSDEENLAELTAYREAIGAAAKKKSCVGGQK